MKRLTFLIDRSPGNRLNKINTDSYIFFFVSNIDARLVSSFGAKSIGKG